MVDILRQQYHAALQLQQRRCQAYHTWKEHFSHALVGDAAASDVDRVIQTVVLKDFQEVSTGLRQLQTTLAESLQKDNAHTAVASSTTHARALLVRWIDAIQEVEKEHYEVSVQLASLLANHCSPNVVPLYMRQAACDAVVAERAKQKALAKQQAKQALDKMEQRQVAQPTGATTGGCAGEATLTRAIAGPVSSDKGRGTFAEAQKALSPSLSLHDEILCPLTHAVPRHERGSLFFVHCSGSVDLLGDDSEQEAEEREEREEAETEARDATGSTVDEDDEETGVIVARADEAALRDRQDSAIAYYAPRAVALRCLKAERACADLRRRNARLQERASDLYEELQCELSDL